MKKFEYKRENRMLYRNILLETSKKDFDFNLVEEQDIKKLKGIQIHPLRGIIKDQLNLVGLVETDVNKHLYNRCFDGRYSQFLVSKEVYESILENSVEKILLMEDHSFNASTHKVVVREMV